jgi:hypothetical protein
MLYLNIRRRKIPESCPFVGLDSTLILSSPCIAGEGSPMLAEGRVVTDASTKELRKKDSIKGKCKKGMQNWSSFVGFG